MKERRWEIGFGRLETEGIHLKIESSPFPVSESIC